MLDPFVGSGTAGRETLLLGRRFLGFDLNPLAIELSKTLLHPPLAKDLNNAFQVISTKTKDKILESYLLDDGETSASHYLWNADSLEKIWRRGKGGTRQRVEIAPSPDDLRRIDSYSDYRSKHVRNPRFFTNGRINASPEMSLNDLFTPRAQRNLDLLVEAIRECPPQVQPSLLLCLTAASGQMSRMVFAVTGRGKTNGDKATKIEVGSWVIGFWRPKLHFEVNVWNCFERRANKLIKAVANCDPLSESNLSENFEDVINGNAHAFLGQGDARKMLSELPNDSVDLVLTDPPHSDRMPYLELSELWNSILGAKPSFEDELVISNAKERGKTKEEYTSKLKHIFSDVGRVLAPRGFCVVLYNARQKESWHAFGPMCGFDDKTKTPMIYVGCFPCEYSAGSVVQDNRKGSLKSDFAIVFRKASKTNTNSRVMKALTNVPGWSSDLPPHLNGSADE